MRGEQMKTMDLKRMLSVILIFIVVMFALMLTSSYAWYSFQNASTSFDVATNNEAINVTYHNGRYINTSSAIPITEDQIDEYAEKNRFSIEVNDKDLEDGVAVSIDLVDITIDAALKSSSFKYQLLLDDTLIEGASGDFSSFSGNTINISDYVVLNSISDNDFELRLYLLDDGTNQSTLMNKTFRGTISINVVSRVKVDIDKLGADIIIRNVTIDGKSSDYIPISGYYNMTSSCTKGSTLSWEPLSKTITYEGGSPSGDVCSLTFTTDDSPDYPLLSEMPVGSYVAYVGNSGTVGDKKVYCKNGGSASSSTASAETEAPNSCSGQNAREDIDANGNTYGYCYNASYKYYTTGWRIAYKDDSTGSKKAVIVSAGSPECNSRVSSTANVTYIQTANAKALKYCNSDYVDGDCNCPDVNSDGLCDKASTDAWAIGDTDFYMITKAISGVGKRLYSGSSSLGDSGGTLGTTLYCGGKYSYEECGYNNSLLDNGGYYWFAARYSSASTNGVIWIPSFRIVISSSDTYADGLRPVISLSSSVYVTGGSGTLDDPYQIGN